MTRQQLKDLTLYLITDRRLFPALCHFYLALEDALSAGVKAVQLREKDLNSRDLFDMAYWMRDLTAEYGAKLFINDRVDIALAVGADGVHLGQGSIPPYAVRKISGDALLIGVSTHSIDEALKAEKEGADFITFGPVFKTPSKLKYGNPIGIHVIKDVKSVTSIPLLAIGGIKLNNVSEIREAGADGIAMISVILADGKIKETTRELMGLMK